MPKYIKLAETKSTNTYLKRMAALLPSGTVIYTGRRPGAARKATAGRVKTARTSPSRCCSSTPALKPSASST